MKVETTLNINTYIHWLTLFFLSRNNMIPQIIQNTSSNEGHLYCQTEFLISTLRQEWNMVFFSFVQHIIFLSRIKQKGLSIISYQVVYIILVTVRLVNQMRLRLFVHFKGKQSFPLQTGSPFWHILILISHFSNYIEVQMY